MNEPKRVEIDGVLYVPASSFNADETLKALVRAMTSGYYTNLVCHVDLEACGVRCRDEDGACHACQLNVVARDMLGDMKCEADPLIDKLLDGMKQ